MPPCGCMGEPTTDGRFGEFGGRFVPETLMPACLELERGVPRRLGRPGVPRRARRPAARLRRPPVAAHRVPPAVRASSACALLLKREDLNHTGSHKINNVLGQALLAKRMGKRRLVAETGAGQHGVATATAAALLGLRVRRVHGRGRHGAPGAQRVPHAPARRRGRGRASSGSRTLKDAVNEAMRDWVATVEDTHYCLGSVMGPHPYPWMVRELHRVIGDEAREQCRALLDGADPDVVVACVGGGSNAAGHLLRLRRHRRPQLVGVEPAGGAAIGRGVPGVVHGMKSYLMQDEFGPGAGGPVDLGRPRLPGRRPRARPPGRHRPGHVPAR